WSTALVEPPSTIVSRIALMKLWRVRMSRGVRSISSSVRTAFAPREHSSRAAPPAAGPLPPVALADHFLPLRVVDPPGELLPVRLECGHHVQLLLGAADLGAAGADGAAVDHDRRPVEAGHRQQR